MATADHLGSLPTVKEMHLQRVATMAAAAATAQQISAEVESQEQFARELRSYRSQAVAAEPSRGPKPSWDSDFGAASTFDDGPAVGIVTSSYAHALYQHRMCYCVTNVITCKEAVVCPQNELQVSISVVSRCS